MSIRPMHLVRCTVLTFLLSSDTHWRHRHESVHSVSVDGADVPIVNLEQVQVTDRLISPLVVRPFVDVEQLTVGDEDLVAFV